MKVNTNVGALVSASVVAAVLTVIMVGDGTFKGSGFASNAGFDIYALSALRGALIYIVLFLLFHLGLRKLRIGGTVPGRWAYAGIGAAAALLMDISLTPLHVWKAALEHGRLIAVLCVPALAGAVLGFTYHWRAGLDTEGDEPARLAAAVADGKAATPETDPALIAIDDEEYFDGPLQVRTSAAVMFTAALLGAGLFGLARYAIGASVELANSLHLGAALQPALMDAAQSQLVTVLIMGLAAPVPFAVVGFFCHFIVKGLDKTSYSAYAVAGLFAPLFFILPLGVLGPMAIFGGAFIALQSTLALAITMCIYRSMAGLEPKPVKEDIILNQRRNLVGADHARRKFGRLVKA